MAVKLVVLAVIFFMVAGRLDAWPAALVAVPLAALVSTRLGGGGLPRLRVLRLLGFLPWFFAASVRGGIDVARRAAAGRSALTPALLPYIIRLRGSAARLAFVDAVSLLPGTLSADLRGDELSVHTLDRDAATAQIHELERRIAAVFGEPAP